MPSKTISLLSLLKSAVAGFRMAHLTKITLAFEFSALTLTEPRLRSPCYYE
jgi:hypothetical protein